jgi:hypothetical protein
MFDNPSSATSQDDQATSVLSDETQEAVEETTVEEAATESAAAETSPEAENDSGGLNEENDADAEEPAPTPAAAESASKAPAKPEKIVNPVLADPYEFDKCTVAIQIVLLPTDGDPHGREVVIGVRTHQDAPIIRVFRMDQVPLQVPITDLLEELKAQLPGRAMEKIQRETKEAKKHKPAPTAARPATASNTTTSSPTTSTPPPAILKKAGKEPTEGQLSMFNEISGG